MLAYLFSKKYLSWRINDLDRHQMHPVIDHASSLFELQSTGYFLYSNKVNAFHNFLIELTFYFLI